YRGRQISILLRLQLLCQRRRKHQTFLFAQPRRIGFQQHTCEFCTDTEVWYRDLSQTCNGCLLSTEKISPFWLLTSSHFDTTVVL
uniref:Uncharacterized protein n=1 Tax=Triticum urartu TaxID=4572 RepID=A0A8R7QI55_TRIUA